MVVPTFYIKNDHVKILKYYSGPLILWTTNTWVTNMVLLKLSRVRLDLTKSQPIA